MFARVASQAFFGAKHFAFGKGEQGARSFASYQLTPRFQEFLLIHGDGRKMVEKGQGLVQRKGHGVLCVMTTDTNRGRVGFLAIMGSAGAVACFAADIHQKRCLVFHRPTTGFSLAGDVTAIALIIVLLNPHHQRMPGNDVHGGFASHLDVPAAPLVPVGTLAPGDVVRLLSVVADALSTAWQAVARADVQKGDAVFVIGAGGVGGFVAQIAHALGARVIACDVRADTLERLLPYGVEEAVMTAGLEARDVRKRVHAVARGWGVPSLRWRVFECSGHPAGQLIAYSLLQRASTLVQVGFTRARVELRLSNLMAFDATVHGSWGCPPEAYPDVLRLIADGRVVIEPFVDIAPLSRVGEMLQAMAEHRLTHRMILVPDDK